MKKRMKGGTKGSKHHGNQSYKKPGKPIDPQDHVAANIPPPQGGLMQGKQLGMDPAQATMPQTMQGPADYPGQELGA